MMSEQDKLRAELNKAIARLVKEEVRLNRDSSVKAKSLADDALFDRVRTAIDALLGDVVAAYPHTVVRSKVELEPVEDRGFLICTGHANNLFQNVQLADWERPLCAQLDEDATYEMTISLRKVNT